MRSKPPESEARIVISVMVVITFLLIIFMTVVSSWSLTLRSTIIIIWIGLMMAVLRRYRL